MQIYNEKEQAEQVKSKNWGERGTRKWNGTKSCVQVDKQIQEILILNGINGVVASEQAPTQLSFQLVKRN